MVQTKSLTPFFSLITCTKNSAKFLPTCLASVKKQTFRDFEHIIVDGESSDETKEIISNYTKKSFTTPAKGIANAMNIGIRHARGHYLYFLNSDDSFYDAEVLQKVHDFLVVHPRLDWVFGRIHETTGKKTVGFPPRLKIFQGNHVHILKYYNYIPHQATFVKKSVFNQFGLFDETLQAMMDPEYWLRVASYTAWDYMPIIVAHYRIHPSSVSENPAHLADNTREYEQVQAKYLNAGERAIAKIINKVLR